MLDRILNFQSGDCNEVYFLKCEALWIFVNLSFGNDQIVKRLLIKEPGEFDDVEFDQNEGLLQLISKMLKQIHEQGSKDLKVLNLIYLLTSNLAATSKEICSDLVNETMVLHSFQNLLRSVGELPVELYNNLIINLKIFLQQCTLAESYYLKILEIAVNYLNCIASSTEQDSELMKISEGIIKDTRREVLVNALQVANKITQEKVQLIPEACSLSRGLLLNTVLTLSRCGDNELFALAI